jgi:hypothetical protein
MERVGGPAYMNFCADGETLLVRDLDLYVKALVQVGHYAEIITNATITPALDKFLSWDRELLKRVEFKCSFHYLELKKRGLLETFAANVQKIWAAGASASIEMIPSDDLIPYIDEVKLFSMQHFGALPQLSIVRDDRTSQIARLTSLCHENYLKTWRSFDSNFWEFKNSIFGKKQTAFCYAGAWSLYINLCDGQSTQCYCGNSLGNVFAHPEQPLPSRPVGKCKLAHCFNGHVFCTLGVIPGYTVRYGDIRNRQMKNGGQWLQPELLSFFNTELCQSNRTYSSLEKIEVMVTNVGVSAQNLCVRGKRYLLRRLAR